MRSLPRDGLVPMYQDLAKAILLLARDDTHRALADLEHGHRLKQALGTIEDVAVFVTSEWAEGLCGLVGADYEAYRDIIESALNEAHGLVQDETKGTPLEMSAQAIDCILYNRKAWREKAELIEGRTSASIVVLPLTRIPGDPVGQVAVSRATITKVLDAAERALKGLPREHQRIAMLKWDRAMTHREIADEIHYSEKTVWRRVSAARASVRAHLAAMDKQILSDFWLSIDRVLSGE